MKRRWISLLLVLCIVLGMVPMSALATSDSAGTTEKGPFEYKITDNATYTITGDEGGVNGHCWLDANEVHIAMNESTPSNAAITLQERSTTITLVDGFGEYKWSTGDDFWGTLQNWTVQYKIDKFPTLIEGHEKEGTATVEAKSPYTLNLDSVFCDPDIADTLTYQVKVGQGEYKNVTDSNYSFIPETADVYTLIFRAYDGFVYSKDTYTVIVNAINSEITFDVIFKNLPENVKFYANNGFNSDGTDIQGTDLTADYTDGNYTVKVPQNVSCVGIDVAGAKITAEVSESANVVSMQKTSFNVFTKAGNSAEATIEVKYGNNRKAIGVDNVFYLVANEGYTFTATPIGEYASMWTKGSLTSQVISEKVEDEFNIILEVRSPKTITVDSDADLNVYYQNGYYKLFPVEPAVVVENENETTTYTYACPKDQAYSMGYMYFATKGDLIDKAGYMMSGNDYTVTWNGDSRTNNYRGTYTSKGQGSRGDDSILVNINSRNHLVMDIGDTFRLRSFRIWEIINTDTENVMIEPQFTYSGYDKDIISIVNANEKLIPEKGRVNGTGGNNWMDITAENTGTTFLEVGYEAIHLVSGYREGSWGGAGAAQDDDFFNAVDPNRTALIVVQTDGNAAKDVKFGISCLSSNVEGDYYEENKAVEWDAEFDTLYFAEDKGQMTLNPTATSGIQSVAVSYDKGKTWTALIGSENGYTMDVYEGNNIIRVINGNGQTAYQVVRGDKITYEITLTNDADKNKMISGGDTVRVTFHGMHNPIGKMSGIYNPGYGQGQRITYTWGDGEIRQSAAYQYEFVSNAWIDVTVPENASGDLYLTKGYINLNVMGDGAGNHRNLTDDGRGINTTAGSVKYTRSLLPDIKIYSEEILRGDMDGNGQINVTDVNKLIDVYRSKTFFAAGDMNNDGKIDVADVNLLINAYRNK